MNGGAMSGEYAEKGDLRERTMQLGLRVVRMYGALPKRDEARILGRQVLRSGTSVGAHYREACRARSRAEFVSKMEGGAQELDETLYWLELLDRSGLVEAGRLGPLRTECEELMSIFTASVRTAKRRRKKKGNDE